MSSNAVDQISVHAEYGTATVTMAATNTTTTESYSQTVALASDLLAQLQSIRTQFDANQLLRSAALADAIAARVAELDAKDEIVRVSLQLNVERAKAQPDAALIANLEYEKECWIYERDAAVDQFSTKYALLQQLDSNAFALRQQFLDVKQRLLQAGGNTTLATPEPWLTPTVQGVYAAADAVRAAR